MRGDVVSAANVRRREVGDFLAGAVARSVLRSTWLRLLVARGALKVAEVVAPATIAGTSTSNKDGRPLSWMLVVGTDEMENGAAVVHAADRVREHYSRVDMLLSAALVDDEDGDEW